VAEWLTWLLAAVLVVVLLLSGTFSLALRLPSRSRIRETLRSRGREHELAHLLAHRTELHLGTASLRAAASLGIVLVIVRLCQRSGIAGAVGQNVAAFVVSLGILVVFGVAVPSAWARYSGPTLLTIALPALHALRIILFPVIAFSIFFDEVIRRLAGAPRDDARSQADEIERELLTVVSEGEAHGAMDEEEKEMIESVIDLRDAQVGETMTPRTDIDALPKEASLAQVRQIVIDKGHSRIPVYDGTIDNILGILYAKDLLALTESGPFDVTRVMRQALFIPESKRLRDLLHEFREKKLHIAIVLDEYGGTAGLVTIEDILEELVGEIADEYEPEEPAVLKRIDAQTVEVDARMRVADVNDALRIRLPEGEDYDTIGGFVFSSLGRIPTAGETCEHGNVRIEVTSAEPRRIHRVRLHMRTDREAGVSPAS